MLSNQEVYKKRDNISEALHNTKAALEHDDYKNKYKFLKPKIPSLDMFEHDTLHEIITKCDARGLGFDSDLILQHLEKEALERFNQTVIEVIKGKSIKDLMMVRHEIELFMLNDRLSFFTGELDKLNKTILEIETGVSLQEEVIDIKKSVKKKK